MNFCSAETEATLSSTHSSTPISPRPISSFASHAASIPIHSSPSAFTASTWPWSTEYEHDSHSLAGDLEESLEELEEGLDVLMILERAYESAIKAHVVPTNGDQSASPTSTNPIPQSPVQRRDATSKVESTTRTAATPRSQGPNTDIHRPVNASNLDSTVSNGLGGKTALLQGSSTALLAVLDHSHQPSRSKSPSVRSKSPTPTLKTLHPAPQSLASSQSPAIDVEGDRDNGSAVLKIAHLGDCMGMLVRGEEIVWRSEEMWWSVSPSFIHFLSFSRKLTFSLPCSSTHQSNLAPYHPPPLSPTPAHLPSQSSKTISSFSPQMDLAITYGTKKSLTRSSDSAVRFYSLLHLHRRLQQRATRETLMELNLRPLLLAY